MNPGEHWPRRDGRELLRSGGLNGGFGAIAAQAHAAADPGVPTTGRRPRQANAEGRQVAAAGGVGRLAGQHAEGRAAVAPRAGQQGRIVDLGRSSLAQLWGPRYHTYAVPKRDFALFSLGRHPETAKSRLRAERMAERMHAQLDGSRMLDRNIAEAHSASETRSGTPRRRARSRSAGRARERRPCGPCPPTRLIRPTRAASSPDAIAASSGRPRLTASPAGPGSRVPLSGHRVRVARRGAAAGSNANRRRVAARRGRAHHARRRDARRTRTPAAERRCLLPARRRRARAARPPRADQRQRLWTSRVWPGALLVDGEIRGTWRRAQHTVRIETWGRLSPVASATRSRPRPPPSRFQAWTAASRWSGTNEQRLLGCSTFRRQQSPPAQLVRERVLRSHPV